MRGKLRKTLDTLVSGGDHPRGCGENDGVPANFDDEAGSPPRMRGKHPLCTLAGNIMRITPADAGKTPQLPPVCLST